MTLTNNENMGKNKTEVNCAKANLEEKVAARAAADAKSMSYGKTDSTDTKTSMNGSVKK